MRKLSRALVALALAGIMVPPASASALPRRGSPSYYRVTITDLASGQPLTPPVIATHRKRFQLFEVGEAATLELKEIAENGNLVPMVDTLNTHRRVFDVDVGTTPLVPSARQEITGFSDSATFYLTSARGAKYLSWASMLICTNDGFTGVDGIRLPRRVGQTVTLETAGYDAGTEVNTEDFADIVPPCQDLMGVSSGEPGTGMSNPALAEGGVIAHHPGIMGGSDLLPEVHGWTDPVAEVTITAIK
jgi:hypothetical protein